MDETLSSISRTERSLQASFIRASREPLLVALGLIVLLGSLFATGYYYPTLGPPTLLILFLGTLGAITFFVLSRFPRSGNTTAQKISPEDPQSAEEKEFKSNYPRTEEGTGKLRALDANALLPLLNFFHLPEWKALTPEQIFSLPTQSITRNLSKIFFKNEDPEETRITRERINYMRTQNLEIVAPEYLQTLGYEPLLLNEGRNIQVHLRNPDEEISEQLAGNDRVLQYRDTYAQHSPERIRELTKEELADKFSGIFYYVQLTNRQELSVDEKAWNTRTKERLQKLDEEQLKHLRRQICCRPYFLLLTKIQQDLLISSGQELNELS